MSAAELSLNTFLDALASQNATPGGGGAAALMGAQAAALVAMVCRLTIGKPKYAAADESLRQALQEAETLRARLTAMIDEDAQVFDRVMACYRLPKQTESEKQSRADNLQAALTAATDAPLECAQACLAVLHLARRAAEQGSQMVISDAGVAAAAAQAGVNSAALNVRINAALLKDREYAAAKLAELDQFLEQAADLAKQTYELTVAKLG